MNNLSMGSQKPILFLSYGEDILQNKILQNQFIEFARGFDKAKYDIHVLSVMPISRSRLFKNQEWHKSITELSESLKASQVHFSYFTLPALASWLYSTLLQFFFFHNVFHYLKLFLYIRKHKIRYVYCRGYHAGLAANFIKRFFIKNLVVQFDPRSLFIEEALYLKKLGPLSASFWKKLEGFICTHSDLVTFVSEPFEKILTTNYKIKNSLVIYNHVAVEKFPLMERQIHTPLTFVYSGQLDNTGWHRTEYLFKLFKKLNETFSAQFLIITKSDHKPILKMAQDFGIKEKLILKRAENIIEVSNLLSQADLAVMAYKPCTTHHESLLAQIGFGSKSGEYLASGLPMICNGQVRGISEILERYNVGVTYQINDETSLIEPIKSLLLNYPSISMKCREVAKNHFDLKNNIHLIQGEMDKFF